MSRAPERRHSGVRLLCASDLHLGRVPSRLPPALASVARTLSPAAAWHRAVDLAIELQVDGVVLGGDVVEQDDDFYEAFQDLRLGVERLSTADIPVVAVAGNHDMSVLPRLAAAVPGFRLLGAGGRWEELELSGRDGTSVTLVGWSFPEGTGVPRPFAQAVPENRSGLRIGLLHCDRDAGSSRYAPVSSAELMDAAVDAWLLGHVHKPDSMEGERPVGYLGSISGMDPGEGGARGVWLLDLPPGGRPGMRQVSLAPLRWEELAVSVDDLVAPRDIHARIIAAIDELHDRLGLEGASPKAVGCRVVLTGRSDLRRGLRAELESVDLREETQTREGVAYFVHDWRVDTVPTVDLEALAGSADPVGLLAGKLLLLRADAESAERRALLAAARDRLEGVAGRRPFHPLGAPYLTDGRIAELLEAAALEALDALLAQREGSRETVG